MLGGKGEVPLEQFVVVLVLVQCVLCSFLYGIRGLLLADDRFSPEDSKVTVFSDVLLELGVVLVALCQVWME